jgi:hypothetical protein
VLAGAADTVLTEAFGIWWPGAPHRVLRSAVEAANALADDQAGQVTGVGDPVSIPRFAVSPPTWATRGHIDAMALYAGQSVGAVAGIPAAAEVVREIVADAERLLTHVRGAAARP